MTDNALVTAAKECYQAAFITAFLEGVDVFAVGNPFPGCAMTVGTFLRRENNTVTVCPIHQNAGGLDEITVPITSCALFIKCLQPRVLLDGGQVWDLDAYAADRGIDRDDSISDLVVLGLAAWKNQKGKTYSQKLRDVRWQKKRLEILNRDGWKCLQCGKSEDICLNVHHKYYKTGNAPWDYPEDAFESLCDDCHASRHPEKQNGGIR